MRTTILVLALAALAVMLFLYLGDAKQDAAPQPDDSGPNGQEGRPRDPADLLASDAGPDDTQIEPGAGMLTADAPDVSTPTAAEKKLSEEAEAKRALVDGWMNKLDHKDNDLVFSATLEIAKLGDLRATDPLLGVLRDHEDFYVRLGAATALGALAAADAVPALIDALADKDDLVRTASAAALHKVTGKKFGPVNGLKPEAIAGIQHKIRSWWRDNESEVRERLSQPR